MIIPKHGCSRKLSLVRLLYERGYSRDQVLQLFRLIDWMMALPEELTISFEEELSRYEEERRMPYITSIERLGIQRGIQQGIQQGMEQGIQRGMEQGIQQGILQNARESVIEVLETRFEEVPSQLSDRLNSINDLALLKQLHKQAITIPSPEEFEQVIAQEEEES